uniref:Metalloendopeptidase n=1 Tax=Strongyloides venezuelensis TaxID=75913 RepID=A0A0K0FQ45_STRVS
MKALIFLIIYLFYLKKTTSENNILERQRRSILVKSNPPYPLLPRSVKFFVHKDIISKDIELILATLSKSVCLKFEKQNMELSKIGINFYLTDNKTDEVNLSSSISQPTKVYLTKSTLRSRRLVNYHIGLALGLTPEISRHDRNNFVTILWNNIDKPFKKYFKLANFSKKKIFNTAFDFGSTMLLSPSYGSKNNVHAYKSKLSPYYIRMNGKIQEFSYNDIKLLNDLYCDEICKNKIKGCKNSEYPSNKCTVCRCPKEFTGKQCKFLARHVGQCGNKRFFWASKKYKYIAINNFDGLCYFSIYSKPGTAIEITIEKMRLHQATYCGEEFGLEIKHHHDKEATGLYLRGNYNNVTVPGVFSHVVIRYNIPKNFYRELKLSFRRVKRKK